MDHAILHVIRSMNPAHGGPVEVVRQFTRVHREMGCAVEVATLDAPGDAWLKDSPFTVHALGEQASTLGEGYGFSSKFVPWLKEHRHQYAAVISHGLWQYNNAGTREALRGTDTPYFVFPHGMLDPWFKRAYPAKHLKKWIYWMLRERRVLRDARAVLYTCEEERRLAAGTFPMYRCNDRVVPLGIEASAGDAEQQKRLFFEKFPELREKRIHLFLGRLHDKKGCDMLIEAFGKMPGQVQGNWHLVMAGPCADDDYRTSLEQLVKTHCPPDSVTFPGMLTGDMKWGAYYSADAFVLPSHQENFGIAVAEALACGVPVLISNKVNIWREIAADRAGIVETDDPGGTLALLNRWHTLPDAERAGMRAAATACFANRFEIRKTAHELLDVIAGSAKKADSPDAAAIPD